MHESTFDYIWRKILYQLEIKEVNKKKVPCVEAEPQPSECEGYENTELVYITLNITNKGFSALDTKSVQCHLNPMGYKVRILKVLYEDKELNMEENGNNVNSWYVVELPRLESRSSCLVTIVIRKKIDSEITYSMLNVNYNEFVTLKKNNLILDILAYDPSKNHNNENKDTGNDYKGTATWLVIGCVLGVIIILIICLWKESVREAEAEKPQGHTKLSGSEVPISTDIELSSHI